MSISHKNMPKIYGTLELNFFLHFCIISTIIRIVNRNPFMILFAPLCIIYLYSPHESHQLPPGGSLRWNYLSLIEPVPEQFHQKQYYNNWNQHRCQER